VNRYIAVLGISLSAFVLLGFLAYTFLEIYPRTRETRASREAMSNEYLALDRWLTQTGRPVRLENWGSPWKILEVPEKIVFIQASLFYWTESAWEALKPWVEGGGALVVSLDTSWDKEETGGIESFLDALGIEGGWDGNSSWYYNEGVRPDFDQAVIFNGDSLRETYSEGEFVTMDDQKGLIRLVRVFRGQGSVTVTGRAYFLRTYNIKRDINARLAWYLFSMAESGELENPGVFFIRGPERIRSLWGRLADRGNFTFIIVSALVLLVIGFWMVIPGFGVLIKDDERPGKPIRERFLAESRFLKKYGALDAYRALYLREIKARLLPKLGDLSAEELPLHAAALWGNSSPRELREVERALSPGAGIKYRNFTRTIEILKTILEHL
jgi:hypothetical protein